MYQTEVPAGRVPAGGGISPLHHAQLFGQSAVHCRTRNGHGESGMSMPVLKLLGTMLRSWYPPFLKKYI